LNIWGHESLFLGGKTSLSKKGIPAKKNKAGRSKKKGVIYGAEN